MSDQSDQIRETDVSIIRDLIQINSGIAIDLRLHAERLHCSDRPDAPQEAPPVVSSRVGKEFIDSLKEMRTILLEANEALTGFNG